MAGGQMIYRFRAAIYTEGGRALIRIPFNVWEETDRRGMFHAGVYPWSRF